MTKKGKRNFKKKQRPLTEQENDLHLPKRNAKSMSLLNDVAHSLSAN